MSMDIWTDKLYDIFIDIFDEISVERLKRLKEEMVTKIKVVKVEMLFLTVIVSKNKEKTK